MASKKGKLDKFMKPSPGRRKEGVLSSQMLTVDIDLTEDVFNFDDEASDEPKQTPALKKKVKSKPRRKSMASESSSPPIIKNRRRRAATKRSYVESPEPASDERKKSTGVESKLNQENAVSESPIAPTKKHGRRRAATKRAYAELSDSDEIKESSVLSEVKSKSRRTSVESESASPPITKRRKRKAATNQSYAESSESSPPITKRNKRRAAATKQSYVESSESSSDSPIVNQISRRKMKAHRNASNSKLSHRPKSKVKLSSGKKPRKASTSVKKKRSSSLTTKSAEMGPSKSSILSKSKRNFSDLTEDAPFSQSKKSSMKKIDSLVAVKDSSKDPDLQVITKNGKKSKEILDAMPLLLPKTGYEMMLVQIEDEKLKIGAEVGAIGRFKADRRKGLTIDLKGKSYKASFLQTAGTFAVVSYTAEEAKIEAVSNEVITLDYKSSIFDTETLLEGTLDAEGEEVDFDVNEQWRKEEAEKKKKKRKYARSQTM
eukprot:CAMPEP_0167762098 /NCGR_PEP_ID=MMETSP0110_2-20121227/12555_1 /TAXON_ID=629695 /ORGANISM="Gymnochlora sp., Strain CCMP2014" /LENGTH=488 /DNA_ID=CAMNT_0007648887 /DNA_START=1 /DNA_END=1468 /DNA_ORIENTATION=-